MLSGLFELFSTQLDDIYQLFVLAFYLITQILPVKRQ